MFSWVTSTWNDKYLKIKTSSQSQTTKLTIQNITQSICKMMICPIFQLLWHTETDEVVNLGRDSSLLTDYITLSSLSFTPDSNFQPVLSKYHWRVARRADSDGKVGKLKVHGSNNVRSSKQHWRGFIASGSWYVGNKTLHPLQTTLTHRCWLFSDNSRTLCVLLLLYHSNLPTITIF